MLVDLYIKYMCKLVAMKQYDILKFLNAWSIKDCCTNILEYVSYT